MPVRTRTQAFATVAKTLRDFGYPDCTAEMVRDTWDAIKAGKPDEEMPHGIIGRFAYSQLKEAESMLDRLP